MTPPELLVEDPRPAAPAADGTFANLDIRQDADQLLTVRHLLPSPREVASGAAVEPPYVPPPVEARERISVRRLLRDIAFQMDPRQITAHGPKLPLILLGYFTLIEQLDIAATALLFPDVRDEFGASISLLFGINALMAFVSQGLYLVVGYVSDRIKHRTKLLAAGTVINHASIALRGTAGSVGQLTGIYTMGAVASSVGQPLQLPLVADYYPPHTRARTFAFISFMGVIAAVIAPFVAGSLAQTVGWRRTLEILGGIATVVAFGFFLLEEPVRGGQDRLAAGADPEWAAVEQRPMGWTECWRAAASIRTMRVVWMSIPFTVAASASSGSLIALYYSSHFNLDVQQRGVITSISFLPVLLGIAVGGVVADRVIGNRPGRVMTGVGLLGLLSPITLLLFVNAPYVWLAVVFQVIPQLCTGLIIPAYSTISSLVLPARIRGLGLQTAVPFALTGQLAAVFIGNIADSSGIPTALMLVAAVQTVSAIIIASGGPGVAHDIRTALAASRADEEARRARLENRTKMLVCRDVDVTYDGAQVLFGVDFDVEEGDFVALLGTNGAGKSTLLRAICGVQQVSAGAVFLDGDDITHLPPEQVAGRGVVMMPGGHAVFPSLTVEQNLRAAAWLHRDDEEYVRTRVEEVLTRFPRLRERMGTQAGNLSGGEQQMVALSQALLMKPRLLMIDELSLGLAPKVVEILLDALREIHAGGATIVIVEQSVNVALQVARRAVFMEKGQVRFDGPVSELVGRSDVVRSVFLGNAVTSSALGSGGRRADGTLAAEVERILAVDDVRLHYGGLGILNGVSLTLDRGQVTGIVGPNGAGKTTLFDVIAGFARPDSGTVTYLNRDVTRMPPDERGRLGLGRSYQNVRLFPALTVRENIAVALERHLQSRAAVVAALWLPQVRRSERRVRRRVDNLVESLGLGAYADKFVNELSTGTRRIVDIACLLAAQPRLLLLDEPSSGLAQAESEQLGPVIGRIVKETGCGLLLIEHDLGLIASASDRLVAMRQGEVMAEGTPAAVLARNDVMEALLGGASRGVISRSIGLAREGAEEA